MENYRMRMMSQGGFSPISSSSSSSLPPLPPSRLSRNSNQQYDHELLSSSALPSSLGIMAASNSSTHDHQKLQFLQPHQWVTSSSSDDHQLNLILHENGSGKNVIISEGFPATRLEPINQTQSNKQIQIHQGSEDMDPGAEAKRLRRVMQSRQYSQKYRLKQLHYISQLESELKALQAEVTITSPRIKFVDRQNSLLRAENYSIKEKLNTFTGELMFKEAQYEELKRERNMLKEMYESHQQRLIAMNNNNNNNREEGNSSSSSSYQVMDQMNQPDKNNHNQKQTEPGTAQQPLQQTGHNIVINPFSLLER